MSRTYEQDYKLLTSAGLSHKEADAIATDCHNSREVVRMTELYAKLKEAKASGDTVARARTSQNINATYGKLAKNSAYGKFRAPPTDMVDAFTHGYIIPTPEEIRNGNEVWKHLYPQVIGRALRPIPATPAEIREFEPPQKLKLNSEY